MYKVVIKGKVVASFADRGQAVTYCHQNGYPVSCIYEGGSL